MDFWNKITGNDITKEFKVFESRVNNLPKDYQVAWEKINANLLEYSDFSGRNLIPILKGILEMFEETATDGKSVQDVLGGNINDFCRDLLGENIENSFRDKWRKQLNGNIAKKLGEQGLNNEDKRNY